MLGLNIVAILVIYIFLKRRVDRAVRSNELLSQIELEIEKIVTELNRTTERNVTLIEDRIRNLTEILEQADKKIVLVNREMEKKNRSDIYSRPRVNREIQYNQDTLVESEPDRKTYTDADQEDGTAAVNADLPENPVKIKFEELAGKKENTSMGSSRQRVIDLFEKGENVHSIASKLNITLGEIELILSMNQRKPSER